LRILLNFSYDGGAISSALEDAIRNITGSFNTRSIITAMPEPFILSASGAFFSEDLESYNTLNVNHSLPRVGNRTKFNASLVVPTSYENRPASLSVLYCVAY
jgi:hypothetical protein